MTNQFHNVVIKPFADILFQFFHNLIDNFNLAFFYFAIMILDFVQDIESVPMEVAVELIDTPTEYWVGLFILTSMDFFFGTVRAVTEEEIQWNWHVFLRGVFKYVLYAGALIVSATATNMFPVIFGLFQYAIVAGLCAYETASAFRNMKLLAIMYAAFDFMKSGRSAFDTFKEMVEKRDKELIRKAQRSKGTLKKQKDETDKKEDNKNKVVEPTA